MGTGINWGDIATWVTGIATIALFVIGFIQIRNEREFRIRREKELEESKSREQAEQISIWLLSHTTYTENHYGIVAWNWIAILNGSNQPVYNAIVNLVTLNQTNDKSLGVQPHQACVGVVPPGLGYIAVESMPGLMARRTGVEIGFQDKSGKNWIRMPNGELVRIYTSTIEHYKIILPTSWQHLSNVLPKDEFSRKSKNK